MIYVYIYLGVAGVTLALISALIHSSPRHDDLEESFEREARRER
jgi:hypothetical protein